MKPKAAIKEGDQKGGELVGYGKYVFEFYTTRIESAEDNVALRWLHYSAKRPCQDSLYRILGCTRSIYWESVTTKTPRSGGAPVFVQSLFDSELYVKGPSMSKAQKSTTTAEEEEHAH